VPASEENKDTQRKRKVSSGLDESPPKKAKTTPSDAKDAKGDSKETATLPQDALTEDEFCSLPDRKALYMLYKRLSLPLSSLAAPVPTSHDDVKQKISPSTLLQSLGEWGLENSIGLARTKDHWSPETKAQFVRYADAILEAHGIAPTEANRKALYLRWRSQHDRFRDVYRAANHSVLATVMSAQAAIAIRSASANEPADAAEKELEEVVQHALAEAAQSVLNFFKLRDDADNTRLQQIVDSFQSEPSFVELYGIEPPKNPEFDCPRIRGKEQALVTAPAYAAAGSSAAASSSSSSSRGKDAEE